MADTLNYFLYAFYLDCARIISLTGKNYEAELCSIPGTKAAPDKKRL
jgi:hypothetical protein